MLHVCCHTVYFMRPFTVYPKKYAHGFCFAVLCCGYTLTDFPMSIMLTSLALWQSNDCPSASKATLMNMDKYFMWIHYERLHNHNKAKHNKTVCIFLGMYCISCNQLLLGFVINRYIDIPTEFEKSSWHVSFHRHHHFGYFPENLVLILFLLFVVRVKVWDCFWQNICAWSRRKENV